MSIVSKQVLFWFMIVGISLLFLTLLSSVLLPFVVGLILAYLLNPLVSCLEEWRVPRAVSAVLFIILLCLLCLLAFLLIVPPLVGQSLRLIDNFPSYIQTLGATLANIEVGWVHSLLGLDQVSVNSQAYSEHLLAGLQDNLGTALGGVKSLLSNLYAGGQAVANTVFLLVLAPIVAAYLLVDWRELKATVQKAIPFHQQDRALNLWHDIDKTIAGFIRGQSTVCLSLSLFYIVSLSLLGLPFSVVVGLLIGLLSFIPYVGSVGGFVLSMTIALTALWGEWATIAGIVMTFLIGQLLESYILTPKLVGDRVALHPVWLMFALFAFGYLFGFLGLLIAVPISASLGVLIRYAFSLYRESSFYLGSDEA